MYMVSLSPTVSALQSGNVKALTCVFVWKNEKSVKTHYNSKIKNLLVKNLYWRHQNITVRVIQCQYSASKTQILSAFRH